MFESRKLTKWDNKFLLEAIFWSRSSPDQQTQCGCVLVKDKTMLSSGYNGFIRNVDDDALPKSRPEKYPYMIHAEANAIYNCTRLGRSTLGASAYVTAIPCLYCLQALYQCGIREIIFTDVSDPKCVIGNEDYHKVLKMVSETINIFYIPSNQIDDKDFIESAVMLSSKRVDK
tara:strand:+ start:3404 stop:3922 length:519 start_codon:yes stop_codon:yes gene_type:complete